MYIWDVDGRTNFYGFPYQQGSDGVKVAHHLLSDEHSGHTCSPETINRSVTPQDFNDLRDVLSVKIPTLNGSIESTATCMYTVTPDEHFLVDFHPDNRNIVLASPCSGHGFKFCSVIGEIISELVTDGRSKFEIDFFSLSSDRKRTFG